MRVLTVLLFGAVAVYANATEDLRPEKDDYEVGGCYRKFAEWTVNEFLENSHWPTGGHDRCHSYYEANKPQFEHNFKASLANVAVKMIPPDYDSTIEEEVPYDRPAPDNALLCISCPLTWTADAVRSLESFSECTEQEFIDLSLKVEEALLEVAANLTSSTGSVCAPRSEVQKNASNDIITEFAKFLIQSECHVSVAAKVTTEVLNRINSVTASCAEAYNRDPIGYQANGHIGLANAGLKLIPKLGQLSYIPNSHKQALLCVGTAFVETSKSLRSFTSAAFPKCPPLTSKFEASRDTIASSLEAVGAGLGAKTNKIKIGCQRASRVCGARTIRRLMRDD